MMMSPFRQLFLRIFAIGEGFALLSLIVLTLCITADVVGRYVFHAPVHGAVELGELLMVPIVFIALANSQHLDLFVRVTMLTDKLPTRAQHVMALLSHLVGVAFWSCVLVASWDSAWLAWEYDDVTPGLVAIPMFPAKVAIPFGILLLIIQLCFNISDRVRSLSNLSSCYGDQTRSQQEKENA